MIRHLLLIKFKQSVTTSQIQTLRHLFESIPGQIEGIASVEWGMNNSPENKNKGYTHAVMLTFTDENARKQYLPHPEHETLKRFFEPLLEDIVVFDYFV